MSGQLVMDVGAIALTRVGASSQTHVGAIPSALVGAISLTRVGAISLRSFVRSQFVRGCDLTATVGATGSNGCRYSRLFL
jgi:hypothetical protein